MSTEKNTATSEAYPAKPIELAPFRSFEDLSSSGQLSLVNEQAEYLRDPYTARFLEKREHTIADDIADDWNLDDENYMSNATRELLDAMAERGKTFLVQQLALGLVNSPLARTFDTRSEHRHDLVTGEELQEEFLGRKAVGDRVYSQTEEKAFALLAKQELRRYGENIDPEYLQMYINRIKDRSEGIPKNLVGERAFEAAERDFVESGYLSDGALEKDEIFLINKFRGNFVAMQGRMWHMAYEMSPEAQKDSVEPFSFEMHAVGSVNQREVPAHFYNKFINRELAEYKDIISAGLLYVPVQTSTDSIGFFEETGQLVEWFHTPEDLSPRAHAVPFDIDATVRELFADASEAEVAETIKAHYVITGKLQARNIMEISLGIRFSDMSIEDQIFLCKLLERATPEQMRSVIGQGPDVVIGVARALEFGDDYGDTILSIAEHASQEESAELFDVVNRFREHSAKFAGWFKDFDPEFATATERAMNERLTDALYAIEEIARTGKLEADVAPHRKNPDYENDGRFMLRLRSVKEGLAILKGLEKSLALQNQIITAPDVAVTKAAENTVNEFALYRFSSEEHGDALLYVRPEGASGYDRNFEYGNYDGVEASISFIVNPDDPHHLGSGKDPHGVSIRFDREGRSVDESPFSDERSPIRADGSVSFDISTGFGDARHLPARIGRLIAAGNLLRAAKTGSAESLHHNNNGFDHERYGSAQGFSELATYVARTAEAMISIQQQESRFSRRQSTPEVERKAA